MLRSMEDLKTAAQLTDPAQPLKFFGIDTIPYYLIRNMDIVVDRITHDFRFLILYKHLITCFSLLITNIIHDFTEKRK